MYNTNFINLVFCYAKWLSHRYICLPVGNLINSDRLIRRISAAYAKRDRQKPSMTCYFCIKFPHKTYRESPDDLPDVFSKTTIT